MIYNIHISDRLKVRESVSTFLEGMSIQLRKLSQNELQLVLVSASIAFAWSKLMPCKTTGYLLSINLSTKDIKRPIKEMYFHRCLEDLKKQHSYSNVSSPEHLCCASKVAGVGGLLSVRRDALHSMCHLGDLDDWSLMLNPTMPCTGGVLVVWWAIVFFENDVNKNLNIIIPNDSMIIKCNQWKSMNFVPYLNPFCALQDIHLIYNDEIIGLL